MARMTTPNVANLLTYFRLAAVPFFIVAFALGWHTVAFLLFTLAGLSDLIDGYVARRQQLHSEIGALLDPIADKLLMGATFIALGTVHIIPWWFVVLMLCKDVLILSGIAYFKYARVPFHYGSIFWSKATTLLLIVIGASALLDLSFPGIALGGTYPIGDFIAVGVYIIAVLMVVTALEYVRQGIELLARHHR